MLLESSADVIRDAPAAVAQVRFWDWNREKRRLRNAQLLLEHTLDGEADVTRDSMEPTEERLGGVSADSRMTGGMQTESCD